jgi:regulator of chromosome condensation
MGSCGGARDPLNSPRSRVYMRRCLHSRTFIWNPIVCPPKDATTMERPRRSTRNAATSKPEPAPQPKKPAGRGKARGAKRPATPTDPSPSPPPDQKRSKTDDSLKEMNGDVKPNGPGLKPSGKLTKKTSKSAADFVQTKPYFNPLPVIPEPRRPGLLLFVWGAGNFGQFGMGEDFLGEFHKPSRNKWVEKGVAENLFGPIEGAGIESIAAG